MKEISMALARNLRLHVAQAWVRSRGRTLVSGSAHSLAESGHGGAYEAYGMEGLRYSACGCNIYDL
eukprot:4079998-Prymnesium_polylepis.1